MSSKSFRCPYCGQNSVLTEENSNRESTRLLDSAAGELMLRTIESLCVNEDCGHLSLSVELIGLKGRGLHERLGRWNLLPHSTATQLPDYIPKTIRDDYEEACLIRDLSPKASATLARRCLQGMIRDFHKITKARLFDEIAALEGVVSKDEWDAIDAVRSLGNIGAHMEKDINIIVDVDSDEAQLLLELIEQLFADWYVARHHREKRMASIKALAAEKEAERKGAAKKTPDETEVGK